MPLSPIDMISIHQSHHETSSDRLSRLTQFIAISDHIHGEFCFPYSAISIPLKQGNKRPFNRT
ncbi:MAG: hypothetical protein O4860_09060 [Trichodesmium sp. St2_bin2_1]|nr:hypothetical protein [Trichodesmium sp. St2_bin2_1]